MHILLSNDDGYAAPGLRILRSALLDAGHRVTTVAPDRNRSGASHSLTVLHSLRMQRHEDGVMSLDGTPTDCVMLALSAFMDERPDIVVSGINAGANMGDDTLYSGTVAAAMEGRSLGLPAIAVSSAAVSPKHYPTAARVVVDLLVRLAKAPLAPD